MTLNQLKYFREVCQQGSFTKAAQKLSVSQPAISISIKELEAELQVPLLYRDGKTARMTPAGEVFLGQCHGLLRHMDAVRQTMQEVVRQSRQFRLGVTSSLAAVILPQLYAAFTRQNPDVRLFPVEAPRNVLYTQLEQHQLDAILVSRASELDAACRKVHIVQFDYVFCVSKTHPLAGRKSLTLQELSDQPLVCFEQDYRQISFLHRAFSQYALEPNIVYEAKHLSAIVSMVRYNQMGTFLYQKLAEQFQELCCIPIEPALKVDVELYWSKEPGSQEHVCKLIDCLRELPL